MKTSSSFTAIPLNVALKSHVDQLKNDMNIMLDSLVQSEEEDNYEISNELDTLNEEITFARRQLEIFSL